jgi:4,5-DOPA dioxygenase extradiol
MLRRKFLQSGIMLAAGTSVLNYQTLRDLLNSFSGSERMPMLFVGHGNPMNAIVENSFSKTWKEIGKKIGQPKAILSISAHWLTRGKTMVTAMQRPKTIHDFGGFPDELFAQQYPAPGSPDLAKETIAMVQKTHVEADESWGLDHGTWSVLLPMFPKADIPVFQISIDYNKPPQFHFELAQELKKLREKGVLIMGSGNIVHNLRKMNMSGQTYDWAIEFDSKMKSYIDERNFQGVINFQKLGQLAQIAHPTYDHFLPLIYSLGLIEKDDEIHYFNDSFDLGSVSMRSLLVGKG